MNEATAIHLNLVALAERRGIERMMSKVRHDEAQAIYSAEKRGEERGEKRGERRGEKRGEERANARWQKVVQNVADENAELRAQLAELQAQSKNM